MTVKPSLRGVAPSLLVAAAWFVAGLAVSRLLYEARFPQWAALGRPGAALALGVVAAAVGWLVGRWRGAAAVVAALPLLVNLLWLFDPAVDLARGRFLFAAGWWAAAVLAVWWRVGDDARRWRRLGPALVAAALPSLGRVVVPALTFVTFALVYKLLPDAHVRWRDIWPGALLAALLFLVGRTLLVLFLDYSDTGSAFGAAGSLVVLLVWVFFSANILLLGAEFIKLYATRFGHPIRPGPTARFEGDPIVEEGAPGPSGLSLDERVL